MKPSQAGMLALKLVVTGALLWFVFRKVDIGPLALRLGSLQAEWAALALTVLFGQLLLTGVRWHLVCRLLCADIRLGLATRLILVGQFFNQVLPSTVGGDGMRAWLLSREGISIRRAVVSVICDRAAALVLLTVIVACTLPIVILSGDAAIPSAWPLAIAVDAFTVIGVAFLYLWGEAFSALLIRLPFASPLGVVIRDLRRVLFSSVKSLCVVGLSIVVQVMVVTSIYLLSLALTIEFGAVHLLMLPLIMLVASIPVSFAGWGVRESVMVAGLGFAGVSAADALAVSVSFGIGQMLIGLPGVAIVVRLKLNRDKSNERAEVRSIQ